ncbi:UDP-glucose 4-epimerase GalE [Arenimonas sp.]|uniref:UDP-glucose 4-epimerase GalE n=1 Tax=Arenimonas sp. TaxID=1872635 RepID=UPI0039E5CCA3
MKVLVTGGAGYIGSHVCLALSARGHRVVIVDSFVNSSRGVVARLERLAGHAIEVHELDLRDEPAMRAMMIAGGFDAVVHCAGLKAVGESCERPEEYFDNNVGGSRVLFDAMRAAGVASIVFSSSASVYGEAKTLPVGEDAFLRPTNPYAETKRVVEEMLMDLSKADAAFLSLSLRYFNPVGAHPSGLIGEAPAGRPNNLMPMICRGAAGDEPCLSIFGEDWPTPDGSGVRDYLHVSDLARAHVDALDYLRRPERRSAINLGTGRGVSVKELIHSFERVTGERVPFVVAPRRAGDVASLYADAALAHQELGWSAALSIEDMCRDAWRWESRRKLMEAG